MIQYASPDDFDILKARDVHVSASELKNRLELRRVFVAREGERLIGWLRFGMFWDNIPFMNMLYISEDCRSRGHGRELVRFWEDKMREAGHFRLLTSTQANEQAQFFYRKLGYRECGALVLPGEALEILFLKEMGEGGNCPERDP